MMAERPNVEDLRDDSIVIGIDVGSVARGCHAVALKGTRYLKKLNTSDTRVLAEWCKDSGAIAIGIDAPCHWSSTGRARPAERELMQEKIWCFSTPSIDSAQNHPKNHFGWMRCGALLYEHLFSAGYSLYCGNHPTNQPVCFETFPHAIACALRGEIVSAKRKRQVRPALLRENAIEIEALTNIDWIDAGLCALVAHRLLSDSVKTYGDVQEGFIVVPR